MLLIVVVCGTACKMAAKWSVALPIVSLILRTAHISFALRASIYVLDPTEPWLLWTAAPRAVPSQLLSDLTRRCVTLWARL